jgi:hypothetical protein
MPAAAGAIGGGLLGGIGAGLNQSAANKGPQALYPGLQTQATSGLSSAAAPAFTQLLSLIKTGNPVSTQGVDQAATATHNLQQSQSLAMLREQFGASGLSNSSPAAIGTSNFLANDNANFQSMLAQLNYQSATDAANRSSQATEYGLSALMGPAFTDIGPQGSVAGAVLGGIGQGASAGASAGSGVSNQLQMLSLIKMLQSGGSIGPT